MRWSWRTSTASRCSASWITSGAALPRADLERPARLAALLSSLPVLALVLLAAGCSGAPAPRTGADGNGIPAWQIPQEAFGSQRLYRASYSGPEGEGGFRVTLRLASPDRYQIQAVDPVGRALWGLDVTEGRGLWLDHRARTSCVFEGRFELPGFPLGSFPLLSLPALLLGRVPAEPAGPVQEKGKGEVVFLDAQGRRWSALVSEGVVGSWAVSEEEAPTAWWRFYDGWAILSDRDRGVQVRWRQVLREALQGQMEALSPPASYRATECQQPELP